MLAIKNLMLVAMASLLLAALATTARAERKAFHVTGKWDIGFDVDPETMEEINLDYPFTTREFDIVFVYENELDHPPLVDNMDVPPPTAHAVDATNFLGSQFGDAQSRYLFKSYPVPDIHLPDPTGNPDPSGYSGVSFLRWTADSFSMPGTDVEVIYPRTRRSNDNRPNDPLEIKVVNDYATMGFVADSISIVDHIRVPPSAVDDVLLPGGVIPIEVSRLEITFIDIFGTTVSDKSLPVTLDADVFVPQNGSFWAFNQPELGPPTATPPDAIEMQEVMFGDADLDGDVDADDEMIFEMNLDNDRNGLADDGGAFVYEVATIPDLVETMDVDETQQIGFATWLLGDFNLDGFVTDEDGIYFVPTLPGDGNGDGWVDGLDYLIWAGAFGTHPGPDGDPSDGDYNDDGWVDGLDYLEWAANFGSHSATAVPEPGGIGLLGVAVVGWYASRRRYSRPKSAA